MNKTKTVLAAVGGVTLVATLAAGVFAWSAYSAKTAAQEGNDEGVEGLDSVMSKAERLMSKPVKPSAESVRLLKESRDAVETWRNEAFAVASVGDRRIQPTTDAAFKEFIVGDARRLQGLPAGVEQKMLDAAFDFGPFKPYIAEGKMPDAAALKELQRKWDDVAMLIETLSECGVESVTAIALKTTAAPKEEEATPKKNKKMKAKAKVKTDALTIKPVSYTYEITCRMRPASLVKTLNTLSTSERFAVVNDFVLHREKDTIAEALGAGKAKDDSSTQTTRRRRRGATATAEKTPVAAEVPRVTVVTDPAEDAPFGVKLTVEVYDFQSAETVEENKEGEETK